MSGYKEVDVETVVGSPTIQVYDGIISPPFADITLVGYVRVTAGVGIEIIVEISLDRKLKRYKR